MGDGLVTIVMPMHNDGKYIESSLNSVLCQTYQHFEILIVDDASNDDSLVIVRNRFKDPRIKIFRNDCNKGAAYSRNLALRNATGEWIAFLDADDYWFPQKLERQISFMEKNEYKFSYTQYFEAGEDLIPVFKLSGPKRITKYRMRKCSYMGCLTVMYSRKALGLLQVDEKIKKRNDYALWLLASEKSSAYLLSEPLAIYRRRAGGISSVSLFQKLKWEKEVFRRYVSFTSVGAWIRAFRVAFFTFLKRKTYKTIVRRAVKK